MKKILLLFLFLQPLPSYCMTPAMIALFVGAGLLGTGSCAIICHESGCCPNKKPGCCKKQFVEDQTQLITKQPKQES